MTTKKAWVWVFVCSLSTSCGMEEQDGVRPGLESQFYKLQLCNKSQARQWSCPEISSCRKLLANKSLKGRNPWLGGHPAEAKTKGGSWSHFWDDSSRLPPSNTEGMQGDTGPLGATGLVSWGTVSVGGISVWEAVQGEGWIRALSLSLCS